LISIGQYHDLKVVDKSDLGFHLDANNLGEVLLPKEEIEYNLEVGDVVNVLIFHNNKMNLIATTQKSAAIVGQFAYLPVKLNTEIGAFLDWGLPKDLFVPLSEQHRPHEEGKSYLVYIYLDKINGRITASSKINKFLDDDRPHDYKPKQEVSLIIANSTDLGFKAIINHSHWGVLYANEVFERLSFGDYKTGYIKNIREDGRIDLTLQLGHEAMSKNAQLISDYLEENGGFAAVHDKSDPKIIHELFGLSKNAFKKAAGQLYKNKVIEITNDGIKLI
jgi:hypothetical protein